MGGESAHSNTAIYENVNGVPLSDGKSLHMELGFGDIANRIITVGSHSRAEKIASYFDASVPVKRIDSSRGFTTITGEYNGVPVSVVAIGMGQPMMDFFVRESRAVIKGPMYVVRFGTCGGIAEDSHAGSIVVARDGAAFVTRNYDAFSYNYVSGDKPSVSDYYKFYSVAPADPALSAAVFDEMKAALGERVVAGINITADSFYSSQGRIDHTFDDENDAIVAEIGKHYPGAKSLEMETYILFHLAKCCRDPIYAAGAAIVLSNRLSKNIVTGNDLHHMEMEGGLAVLKAVTKVTV